MEFSELDYKLVTTAFLVLIWFYFLRSWRKYITTPPELRYDRTMATTAGIVALGPVVAFSSLAQALMPNYQVPIMAVTVFLMLLSTYLMVRYIYVHKIFVHDALSHAVQIKRKQKND